MSGHTQRLSGYLFPLAGAVLALGLIASAGFARSADAEAGAEAPLCEVSMTKSNGATVLEAVYNGDAAVGAYRLSARSIGAAGTSVINQGGGFTALTPGRTPLSRISMNNAARYEVEFTIEIDGMTFDCMRDANSFA